MGTTITAMWAECSVAGQVERNTSLRNKHRQKANCLAEYQVTSASSQPTATTTPSAKVSSAATTHSAVKSSSSGQQVVEQQADVSTSEPLSPMSQAQNASLSPLARRRQQRNSPSPTTAATTTPSAKGSSSAKLSAGSK